MSIVCDIRTNVIDIMMLKVAAFGRHILKRLEQAKGKQNNLSNENQTHKKLNEITIK